MSIYIGQLSIETQEKMFLILSKNTPTLSDLKKKENGINSPPQQTSACTFLSKMRGSARNFLSKLGR